MNPQKKNSSSSSSSSEQLADDIWDDSIIIRNYEESLALVKEEVAKRLAMKTNKKLIANSKEVEQSKTEATDAKPQEAESSGVEGSGNEKGANEAQAKSPFKVGDYCRATYEDGVDYEAKILAIADSGDSHIRYVGYNNEQNVCTADLVPSWGRKARRKQREDAVELAAEEDANRMEISDDEKLTKKASKIRINFDPNFRMPKQGQAAPSSAAAAAGFHAGLGGASFMVPPPPPMPPMLEDDDDIESENLSAMLMSWYMSGYYTGLYHGQKMSQKRTRPSQN